MNPDIFREYDIRGIVGKDLDEGLVRDVGRAFGSQLLEERRTRAVVGRDVRKSSEGFARAVAAGLSSAGVDVDDLGVVTTPILYFGALSVPGAGGVMITGSHNPIEYNGIKLSRGAEGLTGGEIGNLRRRIEERRFRTGSGSVKPADVLPAYGADLASRFRFRRRLKVVVDAGNGVAGPIVPPILRSMGHDVRELYCEPDGSFPNHLPDPEAPENVRDLQAAVTREGADLGLGFDGDADRVGVIDERGGKISADWLLVALAREQLRRYPGGTVRFDVKCSDFVARDVALHGGRPVMGRTGHSILKRDVIESGAVLGGELSGHIVFGRDYHPIDDSVYAALRFMELVDHDGATASALFRDFPETFATAEIKAACPDAVKFDVVRAVGDAFARRGKVIAIDGVRVEFPDGWGLVRASNTTAALTLRFESGSETGLARIRALFRSELGRFADVDVRSV